jgi:peptide/nickel transport system permease protein
MTVALAAAISAAATGTLIGAFSAYYHETAVDALFRYLSDIFLIMPAPIVMVIIGARYYESLSAFKYGLLYGLIAGASSVAIVMRSQALTIMIKPFIAASWVAGAGGKRIVFAHLIPHMLPLASVQMMIAVVGAVISYGFIAFVGVSRQTLNWGAMVYDAFMFSMNALGKTPWLQLVSPAVALSLFAAAFYFVSRGLHEVAEPRLRKQ